MKTMGMERVRPFPPMSRAVSKPSSSGMLTSSRMSAQASRRRKRSASAPEAASTSSYSGPARTERMARRFSGRSSTARMRTGACVPGARAPVSDAGATPPSAGRAGEGIEEPT
jgi:hypothetical protein